MQTKFHPSRYQDVTAAGLPVIGSLEFYQTGTSTKVTSYSDYTRNTVNSNPLNADSNGRFGPVFFSPDTLRAGIKVVFYDAISGASGNGSVVYTDDRYGYDELNWDDISALITQVRVGGIMYPRTDAEIAAGIAVYAEGNAAGHIVNPEFAPGDIRRYGDNTSPGTTDMYAAIQAAINQLEQTGGADVVFQSREVYKIGTGLTWYADNSTIHGNGARIQHSADITALTIGELGSGKSMARSRILGGLDFEYTGSAGTSTLPGVAIYQSIEGDYHFNSILNYSKGIYLTATSGGNAYNKVHFDRIKSSSTYGIHVNASASGYTNENKFYCGRFTTTSAVPAGGWHIYVDMTAGGSYRPNHNTFYSPCLEMGTGASMYGYIYDDGQFNTYFEPRLEYSSIASGGTETISVARIQFGTKSKWNNIYGGYNFDGSDISNLGEKNRWFMRDQIHIDAGNAAEARTIYSGMRAQVNDEEKPACLIQDLYGTNTSGDAMVFQARARRNGASGYYYDAERAGSMVTGQHDGFTYECILTHTGTSNDRPGVEPATANWATYWRKLNTKDGGATWSATGYTQPSTQFRVASDGKLWTNQAVADVSAIPANSLYKLPIYNEAGTLLGYVPVVADY